MIKLENYEVMGWEHAIRGMRNPMNSWEKSDSMECAYSCDECDNFSVCNGLHNNGHPYFDKFWEYGCLGSEKDFCIGPNDHDLMMRLANAGPVHGKFRRMITVYVDITAPLYWWKEFDTYKVGTVANSCSTMHKIHEKEFTVEDFSREHLINEPLIESEPGVVEQYNLQAVEFLKLLISILNVSREMYLKTKNKRYWWQMIQLLPSSYNQKRTVQLNYEVLANVYEYRKNHKLDEWVEFCKWIETLPYSEIITGESNG